MTEMRDNAPCKPTTLAAVLAFFILTACGSGSSTESTPVTDAPRGTVSVDVLYLSHLPQADSILAEIDAILAEYESVAVTRYDFATHDGQAFAEEHALSAHPFLNILVNGQTVIDLDGREISLTNFPQGQGTADVPDGPWTLDDLRSILDQATAD